ncbi:hypothetical protein MKW92_052788 [Papaver armeniacum]|nr:hypothetical protein MKW92_052788 [Papaver armeniacum]
MDTRIVNFILRMLQLAFSCAAVALMTTDDDAYECVAFSYLLVTMSLMVPWSLTLGIAQGFSDLTGYPLFQPRIMKMAIIIGDAVLSFMSLAAACSAAAVIDYVPELKGTSRYHLAAALTFFTWVPVASSALMNLWLFYSVQNQHFN